MACEKTKGDLGANPVVAEDEGGSPPPPGRAAAGGPPPADGPGESGPPRPEDGEEKSKEEPPVMILFSNSRSGGGMGLKVLEAFREVLGSERVFDLGADPHPEVALSRADLVAAATGPGLRVVVCGGDGTMTWIMAAVDAAREAMGLTAEEHSVSIATMPLGTGNDLSRSFGWGGKFRRACLDEQWLVEVQKAEPAPLDRWLVCVMPAVAHQAEGGIPTIPEVFSVHEYSTQAVHGPTHQVVTRGLHYSDAVSRHSLQLLSDRDRDHSRASSPVGSGAASDLDFDRAFEESAQSATKTNTDDADAASDDSFADRGAALVAAHVAPSESVLRAGASWRSYDGTFSNYLSLGVDAAGAFAFHTARRQQPKRFSSRLKNQLLYAWLGLKATGGCCGCDGPPPLLPTVAAVLAKGVPGHGDDDKWHTVALPPGARGLIVLNLQSYAGGRDLWGIKKKEKVASSSDRAAKSRLNDPSRPPPDVADGLLELVTTTSVFELASKLVTTNGLGGHANRLCQASELRLKLTAPVHMQIDGEPWLQPPAIVHLKAIGQSSVLRRAPSPGCCA